MKTPRRLAPFLVSHLLVFGFGAVASSPVQADEALKRELKDSHAGERWIYNDWEAARTKALKEKKPIFVAFR